MPAEGTPLDPGRLSERAPERETAPLRPARPARPVRLLIGFGVGTAICFALSSPGAPPSGGGWACARPGEPGDGPQALGTRALALIAQAEKAGDPSIAIDAAALLERAIRLDPGNPDWVFHRTLALVVGRAEDRARASLADLDALLGTALAAKDPRTLYARALVHASFGSNVAEALRLLSDLKNRNPDFMRGAARSLEFHCRVAYTAQLLRARPERGNQREANVTQAVMQAKLAVALVAGDPREPLARRNLAQVYRLADRWEESEAEFRTLSEAYPGDAIVRYGLASVLADQHKYDEAFAQWERFLRVVQTPGAIDPREADSVADAQMRYGVSLDHAGRETDGLKQLRAYVARVPADPRGWYYVGRLLLESEDDSLVDPVEAQTCLERSRELDPWCAGPLQLLRQVYQFVRPDPAQLEAIVKELDDPARQKERKAILDKRKVVRPDGTNGCE